MTFLQHHQKSQPQYSIHHHALNNSTAKKMLHKKTFKTYLTPFIIHPNHWLRRIRPLFLRLAIELQPLPLRRALLLCLVGDPFAFFALAQTGIRRFDFWVCDVALFGAVRGIFVWWGSFPVFGDAAIVAAVVTDRGGVGGRVGCWEYSGWARWMGEREGSWESGEVEETHCERKV